MGNRPERNISDNVLAILVAINDYPGEGDDLEGTLNDAAAWCRLLDRMNVPGRNVAILTDQAPEAVLEKLGLDSHADEDPFIYKVTNPDSGFDALEKFASRHDDMNPDRRLLVAWSGHGALSSNGGHSEPALYLPDGSSVPLLIFLAITGQRLGVLPKEGIIKPGDTPRMAAFINACDSGTPAKTRSLGEVAKARGYADLIDRRAKGQMFTIDQMGIVAFAASSGAEEAREVQIDGQWRGAMPWAVTSVLSRYETDGGSVGVSYAELYLRTCQILDAIGITARPLMFAPTGEINRHVLRGFGDMEFGPSPVREGHTLEIYPGADGKVLHYTVQVGSQTFDLYITGKKLNPSDKWGDWEEDRNYWSWTGFDADATIEAATPFSFIPQPGNKPSGLTEYGTADWPTTKTPGTLMGPFMRIEDAGGTVLGAMRVEGGDLAFYAYDRPSSGNLFASGQKGVWISVGTTGTYSYRYKVIDAKQ